jgi:hypothetical protein
MLGKYACNRYVTIHTKKKNTNEDNTKAMNILSFNLTSAKSRSSVSPKKKNQQLLRLVMLTMIFSKEHVKVFFRIRPKSASNPSVAFSLVRHPPQAVVTLFRFHLAVNYFG